MDIKGLHHNAYRCRDSEETRKFYEDFLGLPLVNAFEIHATKTGRETRVLHHFYQMKDGSCLAFFEVPGEDGKDFEFKPQHDFDLHIALEVPRADLESVDSEGQGARHRDARHRRSRHDRLDLFPRPQRLCDRAHRQASRPRRTDGPEKPTRPAPISTRGRRPSRADRGRSRRAQILRHPRADPRRHRGDGASFRSAQPLAKRPLSRNRPDRRRRAAPALRRHHAARADAPVAQLAEGCAAPFHGWALASPWPARSRCSTWRSTICRSASPSPSSSSVRWPSPSSARAAPSTSSGPRSLPSASGASSR